MTTVLFEIDPATVLYQHDSAAPDRLVWLVNTGRWRMPSRWRALAGLTPGERLEARRVGMLVVIYRAGAAPVGTLAPRQQAVLQHLADGQTVRQIAYGLNCSERTVQQTISDLKLRFQVDTRAALLVKAMEMGAIQTDEGERPNSHR